MDSEICSYEELELDYVDKDAHQPGESTPKSRRKGPVPIRNAAARVDDDDKAVSKDKFAGEDKRDALYDDDEAEANE